MGEEFQWPRSSLPDRDRTGTGRGSTGVTRLREKLDSKSDSTAVRQAEYARGIAVWPNIESIVQPLCQLSWVGDRPLP